MVTDNKLEHYLGKLEKGLGATPVSERAEIITEIKSHILDAQAKNPARKLDDILVAIGEPEQVANRYLIERGLKPIKAPTHPIFKWLIIGFLGTFAIITLFIVVLIWKFTPIIKVQDDRVTMLGGAIDVKDDDFVYFSRNVNFGDSVNVEEKTFDADKIKNVNIANGSGDIKIKSANGNKAVLTVGRKGHKCDFVAKLDQKGELLITTSDKQKCSLTSIYLTVLPKTDLNLKTGSGNINIDSIGSNVVAQTGSGDIDVFMDGKNKAKFDCTTGSGHIIFSIPKKAQINSELFSGSGNIKSDFINKKGANIRLSAKAGSGDIVLKAR